MFIDRDCAFAPASASCSSSDSLQAQDNFCGDDNREKCDFLRYQTILFEECLKTFTNDNFVMDEVNVSGSRLQITKMIFGAVDAMRLFIQETNSKRSQVELIAARWLVRRYECHASRRSLLARITVKRSGT